MNTSTNTATTAMTSSRASQLARASHADDSAEYSRAFDEDSIVTLVEDEAGLNVLDVYDVIDGGQHVGISAHVPLEALTCLGLDVCTDIGILELTGSREEIAKAAALFTEVGAKLQAHLDSLPEVEAVEGEAIVLHYVPKDRSASTVRTLCGEAWHAEEELGLPGEGVDGAETVVCHLCLDAHLKLTK
ncbi:hypothetical protein ACS5PJ_14335 [Pseudarthrobacter sp. YS3]|uniref:hypothetical protein n=1 Tax=Pseudarthrobacter sp. YS3 TaxID=3453718 RepID=UPI003EE9CA05